MITDKERQQIEEDSAQCAMYVLIGLVAASFLLPAAIAILLELTLIKSIAAGFVSAALLFIPIVRSCIKAELKTREEMIADAEKKKGQPSDGKAIAD